MQRDNKINDLISIELKNLERLAKEMKKVMNEKKSDFIRVRAAGSILHDFYCGIEKIFERIAVNVDMELPSGVNWHTELLMIMSVPHGNRKYPVIKHELMEELKEYMRFRHLFRNIYGFNLNLKRFKHLCVKMEDLINSLKKEIRSLE